MQSFRDPGNIQCVALLLLGLLPSLHSTHQWEQTIEDFPEGLLGPDLKVVDVIFPLIPLAGTQSYDFTELTARKTEK